MIMEQSKLDSFFTRPVPKQQKSSRNFLFTSTFEQLLALNHEAKEARPSHAAAHPISNEWMTLISRALQMILPEANSRRTK